MRGNVNGSIYVTTVYCTCELLHELSLLPALFKLLHEGVCTCVYV